MENTNMLDVWNYRLLKYFPLVAVSALVVVVVLLCAIVSNTGKR